MKRKLAELTLALAAFACAYLGVKQWQDGSKKKGSGESAVTAAAPSSTSGEVDDTTGTVKTEDQIKQPKAKLALSSNPGLSAKDIELMRSIHTAFATGDFVSALTNADKALLDKNYSTALHEWILTQMPVLLISAGWARLELGDCETAVTYLRRAETIKRSQETAKGLAVCFYKDKNHAAALDQFSYYLENENADTEMSVLYTDVLESEERFEEAVKVLEDILTTQPADATAMTDAVKKSLEQRLASMRARAKESPNQRVETSRNFRLLYRAEDHEDLVAFVLTTLEDALDEYTDAYQFQAPLMPIEVNLYPASAFQDLVTGGPAWAEGLFDGRLRIPIRDTNATSGRRNDSWLRIVLRHELVHALFATMSDNRGLPPWFEEGMAQRLSCGTGGCGAFSFPPTPGDFLTEASFSAPYTALAADKAGRAYAQSLYLIYVPEYRGGSSGDDVLRQLVRPIGKATDVTSTGLLRPVNLDFAELHRQASDYWKKHEDWRRVF